MAIKIRGQHKGKYISKLLFSNNRKNDSITIIPESIKLIHKNCKGEVIEHEKLEQDLTCYKKIYSPDDLTDKITEHIHVEFLVGNKKEIVEFTLLIQKKLHYTWWDIMMGV